MIPSAKVVLTLATAALALVSTAWDGGQSQWRMGLPNALARISGGAMGEAHRQSMTQPPFGEVPLYQPEGRPRGVVLLLSGNNGWTSGMASMARTMASQGALVAGVSTPVFLKALERNDARCINPNFALVALSQAAENHAGLDDYRRPVVAGYASGATLAFTALAQSPQGIYDGAISLGDAPGLPGDKPWCAATGFTATRMPSGGKSWRFGARSLPAPWIVLHGGKEEAFTGTIPAALTKLFPDRTAIATSHADALPLTIVTNPVAPKTNTMAVFYSGDGGWAGLDQKVAGALAADGIPVVGVDSLRYYWNAKTPAQTGRDLGAILSRYGQQWDRSKAILIGYSFGADALPFAVASLPPGLRGHVAKVALMGLDTQADLQFHLSSWLDYTAGGSRSTIPAVNALKGLPIQCLHGRDEAHSACEQLAPGVASTVILRGGHHFGGNYRLLANVLMKGVA